MKTYRYKTRAKPTRLEHRVLVDGLCEGENEIEAHIEAWAELKIKGYSHIKTPIELVEVGVVNEE